MPELVIYWFNGNRKPLAKIPLPLQTTHPPKKNPGKNTPSSPNYAPPPPQNKSWLRACYSIYRSKTKRYLYQKSLPDFSRYIPIIGDLPLPRFHGPTPLIFFTMSAMRSAAHTRLEPVGLVDTLDSRRAASSLRSHFTSPSPDGAHEPSSATVAPSAEQLTRYKLNIIMRKAWN